MEEFTLKTLIVFFKSKIIKNLGREKGKEK
jgi:hypothetical protein